MLDGRHHHIDLRVYYEDTDAGGIVYHAGYLRFAERARTEFLREIGFGQRELAARDGIAFAVRSAVIDWLAPARLDDPLRVRTALDAVGGASLEATQTVTREDTVLAVLRLRLACLGADLRPARLPVGLRAALTRFLPSS